jgi:hypothetical protein
MRGEVGMHEIKSIGAMQGAKVGGAIYLIIAAVAGAGYALVMIFKGHPGQAMVALFGIPIFYGIVGFIFIGIFCLLYNAIARRIGGVEIELSER